MRCSLCPRQCNADRSAGQEGWCRMDDMLHIASVCLHHGEEPPLSGSRGVVNVFFEHCNMQCVYCQNRGISDNTIALSKGLSLEETIEKICSLLPESEGNLGFVSPSHCISQMRVIIEGLHSRGVHPVIIYNSNGYDSAETIKSLEGLVDVWLPDFKYSDDALGEKYSSTQDYAEAALPALKEMVRQCGTTLHTNDNGIATRGVIVRHLVLPGLAENSIEVLRMISEEVSANIHISLMSQYYPTPWLSDECQRRGLDQSSLDRTVTTDEYDRVVDAFHRFGFHRGWIQEPDSHQCYRPDFSRENPFD